jgi:hypothetical protein
VAGTIMASKYIYTVIRRLVNRLLHMARGFTDVIKYSKMKRLSIRFIAITVFKVEDEGKRDHSDVM